MSPTPPVLFRRADLEEILPLRHAVLRPGLPAASACFEGDDEPRTLHAGAFLVTSGAVVACLSLLPRSRGGRPAWQLRGMATRADLAGHGIGRRLLVFALDALRTREGPVAVWCNARIAAVPFYARCGWAVASDVFEVPGVGPHRVMTAP